MNLNSTLWHMSNYGYEFFHTQHFKSQFVTVQIYRGQGTLPCVIVKFGFLVTCQKGV